MRLTEFSDPERFGDDNAGKHQADQANSCCNKEISVGSTQPSGLLVKRSTALQVLLAVFAVITVCAGSQWLSARSDETDAASHTVLPRPRDMAAETLDAASP